MFFFTVSQLVCNYYFYYEKKKKKSKISYCAVGNIFYYNKNKSRNLFYGG